MSVDAGTESHGQRPLKCDSEVEKETVLKPWKRRDTAYKPVNKQKVLIVKH